LSIFSVALLATSSCADGSNVPGDSPAQPSQAAQPGTPSGSITAGSNGGPNKQPPGSAPPNAGNPSDSTPPPSDTDAGAPNANDAGNTPPPPPPPSSGSSSVVQVHLTPQAASGTAQRVNFAIPLSQAQAVADPVALRVRADGADVPATTRTLAKYESGAVRSVQVQFDLALPAEKDVEVTIGTSGPAGPALVPVTDTLVSADGQSGPRVWALLSADTLSKSGVVGPMKPASTVPSGPLHTWQTLCNYGSNSYSTATFLSQDSDKAVWLYDRGTVFYRGYAATGSLATLRSAYQETSLYRSTTTGTGASIQIGVPGANADLKYHYAQNLAIHYLLTGDDRFREAAEAVALKAATLWSPSYDGSSTDFWTERNAGFLLLAQVWASIVSDDAAASFRTKADATFDAALAVQSTYPIGYTDAAARCFAHDGDAHDPEEDHPYFGCSPWMSAILADGIDQYARETTPARKAQADDSLAKLGRSLARDGADPSNLRPYYWMGVNTTQDQADDYEEHRGEFAYVIALAWEHTGRTDAALKTAADKFVNAFSTDGEVGQLRSFNWQCRSAVATPTFLMP
jgi:hypothetical protein